MTQQFSSPEEFVAWNEAMIDKYHPTHYHQSSNPIVRFIERLRTRRILRSLNPQPTDRILDLGCGAGDILEQVPAGELWGVDISERLVKEAEQRLAGKAQFACGNAEKIDEVLAGMEFDKIFCSEVLEHVQHPDRALGAMARLMKPDGTVVVSIPNERLIDAAKSALASVGLLKLLFGSSVARKMHDEWHLHVFSKSALPKLFREAGLTIQKIYGVPLGIFPLRYVIVATVIR